MQFASLQRGLFLAILIPGILATGVAIFVGYKIIGSKSSASALSTWESFATLKYTSANAELSFDYPSGWSVFDQTMSAPSAADEMQRYSYNNLWICPPDSELIAGPKAGLNNCIIFYTKTRVIHPVAGFDDESVFFSDLQKYVQDSTGQNYSSTRTMQQQSETDIDGQIRLVGLLRDNSNLVGMSQLLCAEDKTAECILRFKHILDSVHFN